ncbi:MAG: hypothetical protein JRG97_03825 [Deltaproteobacteria bacterium]|nr:hypothetical protein [Deltaproteobacteria bacterium]MBW2050864.1 hypothetical protein [Deltaproteobacteria bacterium]MBW2140184.1 hypothetical protein [Deltaproteobacteria bacterium]MBW2322689.1 hypothetical protein [Deltaproteobacteria bacterium]
MKRIIPAILVLFFLGSCATQEKGLTYKSASESPLAIKKIYIQVKDVRQTKEILSPKVNEMKIWSGTGSVINLFKRAAKRTEAGAASQGEADIKRDFRDAMSLRLNNLGVTVIPVISDEGTTMTIDIERVLLDMSGSNFIATVTYFARVSRDGTVFHKERVTGKTEKYNLFGQKTGQQVLNEAFSLAINNLDVKSFLSK